MRSLIALVAAAATIALAGGAKAADLGGGPAYGSFKDEAPFVRPFSWTGGYAGVQLGYAWSDVGARDFDSLVPGNLNYNYDADGFIGGGHIGFNWQQQSIVFGLEADVEYTDLDGSSAAGAFGRHSTDVSWMGSVRARLGLAADRALIYVTGGWAFADIDTRNSNLTAGPIAYGDVRHGWTLGAGAEYAFADNLTGRLEYRYSDFGSDSVTAANGDRDRSDLDMHAIRAGLSFKF